MSDEDDEFWSGESELLGYAFWTRVGKSEAAKKWQTDTLFSKSERTLIGAELAALAVHPKFHRRGIGGMMLKYGIDLAQKEQVPLVLEASRAGTLLYTKNGFRETGRTEMFPDVIVVAMQLDPKV
ncbi:hypothetical protein EAF00_005325 [Botryotinia globosa]|nr:hypothetical protein EAF00_005325 [Botryotinia globosa]